MLILVVSWFQKMKRRSSNRVIKGTEETVGEEVAAELGMEVEYSDMTWNQRFKHQPTYLTAISWISVLLIPLGLVSTILVSLFGIFFAAATGLISQRIYNTMREEKMADELREYATAYSEIVFFAGDSHIDPIKERLDSEFVFVESPRSRPKSND